LPLTQNDKQEQLSLAVLHAIAAKAGFAFEVTGRILDNWGTDARITVKERLDPQSILTEFTLHFQMKGVKRALTLAAGRFSFSLPIAHYNKLRAADTDGPKYLAVFMMPGDEVDWIECGPEQLVLKRCVRWISLRGAPDPPPRDPTVATPTITVYIPETNVLTPQVLRQLATARSKNEWINYAPA
jgi:hypothetical protein